ncbi:putative cellulase [Cavenderia fasciculata]|uniref:Cellulase n=1 Tax=Cavenderia fasciculata TaxID=261658 RepID=F4PQJ2_CACFS|nr:putative cellulase [Cavenderia fasciculata]EGG22655.1 putative cellulase [Cavenderia fasciculata]|eukprot:XP_004360506.1 putative cellulase [Cavenderia fasciculata]
MNNINSKILILFLIGLFSTIALADTCFNIDSLQWRTSGSKMMLNGVEIRVQGIAWFGLETDSFSPGGLQQTSVEALLDILVNQNFNALRLPFSIDMILNDRWPSKINYGLNPGLQGKTALQVLDYIVAASAARGILAIPEQHRFDASAYIPDLWYSDSCIVNPSGQCVTYTEQMTIDTWVSLVNRYKTYWNIWALDIKNEPHGRATWGTGNLATDWNQAFQRISNAILSRTTFPGVFFIEGIENNANAICSYEVGNWWGGNMSPAQCFPVSLAQPNRHVYAPHTFCGSVYQQPYFGASNFPSNMANIWNQHFGFLKTNDEPIIMGEWGCKNNDTKNNQWTDTFTKYLGSTSIKNHLFFSLNPDSLDTDSILNGDYKTINQQVVNYIKQINTQPTKFTKVGNQICLGNIQNQSSSSTSDSDSSSFDDNDDQDGGTVTPTTGSTSGASTTGSQSSTTGSQSSTTGSQSSTTGSPSTTGSQSSTGSQTSTTGSQSSTTGSPSTTGSQSSTTGSQSSTTGSQSSTTTSGTTTSGSTTTTTTTGSSTTGTPTNKITIQQQLSSSWIQNGQTWAVYNAFLTNVGSTPIANLKLKVIDSSPAPIEAWSAFMPSQSDATYWIPQTWALPLQPNQPVNFGYKIVSTAPIQFQAIIV